jgi:predicted ABC-type ATPase
MEKPKLLIVAGPNGSGKTSVTTAANGQFEKLRKLIDSIKKHTITVR